MPAYHDPPVLTSTAMRVIGAEPNSPPKDVVPRSLALATLQFQVQATEAGLTSTEAAARLAEYGPNVLHPRRRRMLVWEFLSRFRNPLVLILLVASGISALTGDVIVWSQPSPPPLHRADQEEEPKSLSAANSSHGVIRRVGSEIPCRSLQFVRGRSQV